VATGASGGGRCEARVGGRESRRRSKSNGEIGKKGVKGISNGGGGGRKRRRRNDGVGVEDTSGSGKRRRDG
jgi:hypothetical protein